MALLFHFLLKLTYIAPAYSFLSQNSMCCAYTLRILYSYSTTNKMHLFLKLFILVKRSTCFARSFLPSSGAQNCTYAFCLMCSFELLMMGGKTVRNM